MRLLMLYYHTGVVRFIITAAYYNGVAPAGGLELAVAHQQHGAVIQLTATKTAQRLNADHAYQKPDHKEHRTHQI